MIWGFVIQNVILGPVSGLSMHGLWEMQKYRILGPAPNILIQNKI